jgi:hypothetical protein
MNARIELLGEVRDMPAEDYHAVHAMSSSALKTLAQSPFHYWAAYRAPGRPARKETRRMFTGTLAHCSVLEPDAMAARYVVVPEDAPRRPTAAQWNAKKPNADSAAAMAWWTEFNAGAAGREVVSADQYSATRQQVAAVLAVPELANLLGEGYAESSVFWIDEATGVFSKARPDWVHPLPDGRVILLDLKSTVDPAPQAFGRAIFNFGYHRQAAHYTQGFTAATGREVAAFVFGAVSAEYPFIAVPYMLDEESRLMGYADRARLMGLYAECERSNTWPAFGDGVQLVSLPAWAK